MVNDSEINGKNGNKLLYQTFSYNFFHYFYF